MRKRARIMALEQENTILRGTVAALKAENSALIEKAKPKAQAKPKARKRKNARSSNAVKLSARHIRVLQVFVNGEHSNHLTPQQAMTAAGFAGVNPSPVSDLKVAGMLVDTGEIVGRHRFLTITSKGRVWLSDKSREAAVA